jgi:hypothetical protein
LPSEQLDLDLVDRMLTAALDEVDHVDVVIVPESAVERSDIPDLEIVLARHHVAILIAASASGPSGREAPSQLGAHRGVDRQCLAAHPPGEAPPLVLDEGQIQVRAAGTGSTPRTPPTTLREPPLEPEELTILLSWAEAIAEALACVPDRSRAPLRRHGSARHGEPRSESRSRLRASATSSTRCDALSTQRFPDMTRGRSMECSPRFGQIDPLRTNSRPWLAVFCGRRWNSAGPASSSSAPTPADVRAGRTPDCVARAALKCSFLSPGDGR